MISEFTTLKVSDVKFKPKCQSLDAVKVDDRKARSFSKNLIQDLMKTKITEIKFFINKSFK